jgi:hypothetical protein
MQTVEQTYTNIQDVGAEIINKRLHANPAYTIKCGGYYAVAVDELCFGSNAELNSALIHEYAHCKTKMVYSEYSTYRTRDYCEGKVLRYIANKIITMELVKQIAHDNLTESVDEVAEILCVTPKFLEDVMSVWENIN